jgi:hypothetical protein
LWSRVAYTDSENDSENGREAMQQGLRKRRLALPSLRPRWTVSTLCAMSKTRSEVLEESRRKGVVAGATTAGAIATGVLVAPFAGAVVAVPAALFVYKWWKHRAENGIRF